MKRHAFFIAMGMILGLAVSASASASSKKTSTAKAKKKVASYDVGEALKPKKSLSFDGRTVEALQPGKFDSFTLLSEGDRDPKAAKLYSLPGDFTRRSREESVDMGYRQ